MSSVRLVLARIEDANMFLRWRNDANTRKAFGYSKLIVDADNIAWLAERLSAKSEKLLVIETEDGQVQRHFVNRVGFVRLVIKKDETQVEISIGKNWRGKGIATEALRLVCQKYGKSGVLSAMIKTYNYSGLWALDKAGFHEAGEHNINGVDFIRMAYPSTTPRLKPGA